MDQVKIGNFLKRLRKEKGITQEQMAEVLNVSGRTVSRWENGKNMPDISLLVDIAQFYEVSISEIIGGERKSEIMNKEEKEIAEKMSDYATAEKEKIFKEIRLQSILGLCAMILYFIFDTTGVYRYNVVLEKFMYYCETLVYVTIIMMAAYTTGSLARLRKSNGIVKLFESLPKSIRYIVAVVIAFGVAAVIKLFLVKVLGL
ncbi:MAG: helix-turn-helix domain-containing protein [Lachnospiraceae bacterium]|nr:helix-turn-helix domain-containing protein [Lachnospiraceae bacterium]